MTKPPLRDSPLTGYAGRVTAHEIRQRPRRRPVVLVGLVGLGLAASLSLTGCFAAPTITGGGTGGAGQSGQSGDGTVTDGGTTTSPPDSGLSDFAGLPAGFPTDEIPLIAGDVAFGVDLGTGWTVVIPVADGPSAFADASVRLTGAGYESLAEQTQPEGSFGVFQNDKYQVQLTIADTNDFGLAATYVAAQRG